MAQALTSPQLIIALSIGIIPSLIWLMFWLRTDRNRPEPFGLLFLCFIMGGACVYFATLLQQATKEMFADQNTRIIIWAAIEEILKLIAFYFIAFKNSYDDEAIDPAIYLIAVALGFAAVENVFYVLHPSLSFNITAGLLTGGLRFFGSTLLHTIASAFIGIAIGISAVKFRKVGMLFGLIGAIFLHATFNFFILRNDTASFLQIYGYLWVAAIISHLILEKLRRLPPRKEATPA